MRTNKPGKYSRRTLKVRFIPGIPLPEVINAILATAAKSRSCDLTARHLVGATLSIQLPGCDVEGFGHVAKHKRKGRKGDFQVNDTVIRVTTTPGKPVVDACVRNIQDGFRSLLLVPKSELVAAKIFVQRSRRPKHIWVESIEDFVGQNLAELSRFGNEDLRDNLRSLFERYNEQVAIAETRRAIAIKIPDNL
jgi:Domain of unknown function (DUF4928)